MSVPHDNKHEFFGKIDKSIDIRAATINSNAFSNGSWRHTFEKSARFFIVGKAQVYNVNYYIYNPKFQIYRNDKLNWLIRRNHSVIK